MQNEIVAHNDLKIRVQEGFFTPVESEKLLENFIDELAMGVDENKNVWQRCCYTKTAMLDWR